MERRLSFLYFFIAWNALAYTGYIYYNRKALGIEYDENETMGKAYKFLQNYLNVLNLCLFN